MQAESHERILAELATVHDLYVLHVEILIREDLSNYWTIYEVRVLTLIIINRNVYQPCGINSRVSC